MPTHKLHAGFRELDPGDTFVGLPQTDFALDSKLETLPRELIQNTYDAREDGEKTSINFFYETLEDGELRDFLDAIDWDTLEPHLEAVAEDDEKLGVGDALDRVRSEGQLRVLGVEDTHAVGLNGAEDSRETNYASLVKDFADSSKKEGGGIHGVGASVLWGFSGFKLVLFNSKPKDTSSTNGETRLVGRLDLPDHELNGQEYKGGGWLGDDDHVHNHPVSLWDAPDELVETLRLKRPDEYGTTTLVVGFREPTRRTRDPEEIVDGIYEAAARYYWPLIVDDGIDVTVQGPQDSTPRPVEPETIDRVSPYLEAYENWNNPDDDFGEPGTVDVEKLDFEVPPTDSEPAIEGQVPIVARLVDEDDLEKYRNKVAMLRGARHVVKYRNYGAVSRTTGKDFHGLLLVGGAKHDIDADPLSWPDADRALESFFRDAEPEAHDTWEKPTQKLKNSYDDTNPSQRIVSFLKTDVKESLQRILGNAETDEGERVETVGSEFPYFEDEHGNPGGNTGGGGGGGGATVFDVRNLVSWFDDAHYYQGTFELDELPDEPWEVTVSINEVDGSNKTIDQLSVETATSANATRTSAVNGSVTFYFDEDTKEAPFEVTSEEVGDEILAGQTRIEFEYDLESGGTST